MKHITTSLFLLVGLSLVGQSLAKDKDTTPIPTGVKLYIAPMDGNLDSYIAGEMSKQKVPVTIVEDAVLPTTH